MPRVHGGRKTGPAPSALTPRAEGAGAQPVATAAPGDQPALADAHRSVPPRWLYGPGLLYKLLGGAAVLVVDIDDEELLFVGEREPISL
jgi:hypothetical protein